MGLIFRKKRRRTVTSADSPQHVYMVNIVVCRFDMVPTVLGAKDYKGSWEREKNTSHTNWIVS
jgi:hypothetical protein